jgi:hypothetical protein
MTTTRTWLSRRQADKSMHVPMQQLAWRYRWLLGACVLLLGAALAIHRALPDPPRRQAGDPKQPAHSNLDILARQLPDCREFHNRCQVCIRKADQTLACSNVGIACSPSGEWQCAKPK